MPIHPSSATCGDPDVRKGNSHKNKIATDSKRSTASQALRVPPFMPMKIGLWFSILERQFAITGIINDEEKSTALISCLEPQYLGQIEEIVMNSPATGQYEKLKAELIRILVETDGDRVQRLVEGEEMGYQKPSQFYHDIKKARQSIRIRKIHPHLVEKSAAGSPERSPGRGG
jgi:hypothetical protein